MTDFGEVFVPLVVTLFSFNALGKKVIKTKM
jgi:hypothetical protein